MRHRLNGLVWLLRVDFDLDERGSANAARRLCHLFRVIEGDRDGCRERSPDSIAENFTHSAPTTLCLQIPQRAVDCIACGARWEELQQICARQLTRPNFRQCLELSEHAVGCFVVAGIGNRFAAPDIGVLPRFNDGNDRLRLDAARDAEGLC